MNYRPPRPVRLHRRFVERGTVGVEDVGDGVEEVVRDGTSSDRRVALRAGQPDVCPDRAERRRADVRDQRADREHIGRQERLEVSQVLIADAVAPVEPGDTRRNRVVSGSGGTVRGDRINQDRHRYASIMSSENSRTRDADVATSMPEIEPALAAGSITMASISARPACHSPGDVVPQVTIGPTLARVVPEVGRLEPLNVAA